MDSLIGTQALVNYDSSLRYKSTNTEDFYNENDSLSVDAIEPLSNNEESLFQNKLDSNKGQDSGSQRRNKSYTRRLDSKKRSNKSN